MKGVIAATNLCFAEKGIYTSEVLAIVLTQLLEVCNLVSSFILLLVFSTILIVFQISNFQCISIEI